MSQFGVQQPTTPQPVRTEKANEEGGDSNALDAAEICRKDTSATKIQALARGVLRRVSEEKSALTDVDKNSSVDVGEDLGKAVEEDA